MGDAERALAGGRDLARIEQAVGGVRRIAYEAAHVYPLSAPAFEASPGAERALPPSGPLKVYLHVPFCNYACSFCFYVKRVGSSREEMERYLEAVERELDALPEGTALAQLYVGGGTPTALPADLLDRALASVQCRLPRVPGSSATVECSPESVGEAHVAVLRARGIERVSMGIESLDDGVLDTIRRHHDARTALEACDRLVGAGFSVNVDLIYGLPGQDHASFACDLEHAVSRGVHSVSVYNLRLNERTPVASAMREVERFDLARLVGWRAFVEQSMRELGFEQRRWHTFVRKGLSPTSFDRAPCAEGFGPGRQIGLGVSAVSHLGHRIYRNDDRLSSYAGRALRGESPVCEVFSLSPADRKVLLIARTLGDGGVLERGDYEEVVGQPVESDFGDTLERLRRAGLIEDDGRRVALSDDGRLVYDLVTLAFYPEPARQWLDARQSSRAARNQAGRTGRPPSPPAG
jgi:oxygen-independent coproporphyrinogen-3 oxidase